MSDTREGQPRGGDTRPCVQLHLLLGEAVERDRGRGLWERADPAVGSGIGADPCPGERPRPLDLRARPGTAHRQGTEGTGCPTRCHTWNRTWNHTEHPTLTSCPTSQPASHPDVPPGIPPWHPTLASHPSVPPCPTALPPPWCPHGPSAPLAAAVGRRGFLRPRLAAQQGPGHRWHRGESGPGTRTWRSEPRLLRGDRGRGAGMWPLELWLP